ncbi:MAG: glycoside hydrolase family 66 protein [Armatimonadota bacterium]
MNTSIGIGLGLRIALGLLLLCAGQWAFAQPVDIISKPGETSLTGKQMPAGVYAITFRLKVDGAPDSVTPLATLAGGVPIYGNLFSKAISSRSFDAANTPRDFTLLLDNFKTQDIITAVTLRQNSTPVPKLEVEQIRIAPRQSVSVGTVWPGKILYYTNETAKGLVTVHNGSTAPQTVTLRCTLESSLDTVRSLKDEPLALQPGERREVPITWNTGKEEYGFALTATVLDGAGKQLDQRREYFSVADNLWKVGMTIGGNSVPYGPGPNEAIPVAQVKKAEEKLAAELAKPVFPYVWGYSNYNEFFAWSPDNYFAQSPEADYWYSGIGNYTMGKRWIQMAIEWLHRRGVRATSYVLPWSGGYGADVVYRKHPEWFVYGQNGQLSWSGYQKKLEVGSNINSPETPWKLQLAPYALCMSPNIANPAAIDAFVDQVVKSHRLFGFDGIRFDTDIFAAGGYDMAGKSITNDDPKRKDELEIKAWQRMRDSLWQKLGPNFVIGNNEDHELYFPHKGPAWSESCRKGCLLMEEVPRSSYSAQSPRNRWHDYLTYYLKTGNIVRNLGGHHLTIAFDRWNPVDMLYLNIFTYAMRTHPYGHYHTSELPLGNYAQFVTRYSALLWDIDRVKPLPNPEQTIAVTSANPVWWKELACERQAPNGKRQVIVHLINPPASERILSDATNKVPGPQAEIKVTLKTAGGEKITRAWVLSAEPDTHQEALSLTVGDGQVSVTVPRLDFWSLVVLE